VRRLFRSAVAALLVAGACSGSGDDPAAHDDDPTRDEWFEGAFVDDVPSISQ